MKKNPIIFIAMLIALAFTSCQMNTDDTGVNPVVPPAPTYKITVTATNGTVSLSKNEAKAGEKVTITATADSGYVFDNASSALSIPDCKVSDDKKSITWNLTMPEKDVTINVTFKAATPAPTTEATSYTVVYGDETLKSGLTLAQVNEYINKIPLILTTDYSLDKVKGVLTLTESGLDKLNKYVAENGEPNGTETPTTPTDSTQWNLDASVIKHENGVGKNDGAFHGTITLNKAKANTGDTVTITVTPDSGYELGELFLGPINGEKQSIGKVNSFTMPNYAVEVTARFDPVDGYNVTFTGRTNLIQGHATGGDSSFNEKYKPGEQVCIKVLKGNTKDTEISFDKTVMLPNEIMGVKISITNGNKDTYEKTGNFYNATFLMPSYDITATVSQSQ